MQKRRAAYAKEPKSKKPRTTSALAVTQEVKRQLARNEDYKQATVRNSTTVDSNGSIVFPLINLTRGDNSVNNFEGSKVTIKNFRIRHSIAAADGANKVRVIVGVWNADQASLAAYGTPGQAILDAAVVPSTLSPLAQRRWENKALFKILADKTYQLQNTATFVGGDGPIICDTIYVPGFKFPQVWMQATGTNGQMHVPFVLYISDSNLPTHPAIDYAMETVFTD